MHLPIQRKLFLSHFALVLLVFGSIGTYFYLSAAESLMNSLRSRLQNSAALISQTIDAKDLDAIREESDQQLPVYQEKLELLRMFRRTNPDIAYLYVMRRVGDRVFFVIDSDETEAQALPGREYPEQVPTLLEGFSRAAVDEVIYTDEWGAFISGYSPLNHGDGEYLVGMDMRATEVHEKFRQLRMSGLFSLIGLLAMAFVFSRLLSSHFVKRIQLLISRCNEIAEGQLAEQPPPHNGDELDNLVNTFNLLSTHLTESRLQNQETEAALKRAGAELESRVEDRTKELLELNVRLMVEIGERRQAEAALAKMAKSDPLTGLLNRRAMMEHLEYQLTRYPRSGVPFALLLCDLDYFKAVNDAYGHDAGDQVLKSVADRLRHSVRAQDLIARWGGEEFLILLPDTDLNGGLVVAEKLCKYVAANKYLSSSEKFQLTLSIGVTVYMPMRTLDDCIKAADDALYEAKHRGRNCVVAA
jgi:diguanylate cyclase (GGDEF)-like protein